ncbi:MAG TPA: response regulator transcription factor [Paludibacteraceae bacterium]|jgi:DNA-binding NarL/FixJ family response regulator|nr:response regulator transcription factor [Paludibacteraceae bacterium]HPS10861.1 response regulator transcription factor [Paludibacteraceae bacterium]
MPQNQINIAILDDHQIIIDGLKLLLESDSNINVVFEATSGSIFLRKLTEIDRIVDIVLLDLMMPEISGFEMALMLKKDYPEIKIIVLSMNIDGKSITELKAKAGIKGFLSKSVDKTELMLAIMTVNSGEEYFSQEAEREMDNYEKISKELEQITLTKREIEIIRLIDKGLINKEIAKKLFISEQTVTTHRKSILRKTGAHNVSTLLNFARKAHII